MPDIRMHQKIFGVLDGRTERVSMEKKNRRIKRPKTYYIWSILRRRVKKRVGKISGDLAKYLDFQEYLSAINYEPHQTVVLSDYNEFSKKNIIITTAKEIRSKSMKANSAKILAAAHSEESNKKKMATRLAKGTPHHLSRPEIREKIRQTSIQKYGYSHHMKNNEQKKKQIKTNLIKYGQEHWAQTALARQQLKEDKISKGLIFSHQGKTTKDWAKELNISRGTFEKWVKRFGIELAIQKKKHSTIIERKIANILETNNISFMEKKKIGKLFPDFIIGDMVVEADGLYWHSTAVIKNKLHHHRRYMQYLGSGYDPIFLRENEIIHKSQQITNLILNRYADSLGLNQYAIVQETDHSFFNNNSIYLSQPQHHHLFLYQNEEKLAGIKLKTYNGKALCYQYTTKKNIPIKRGLSILLQHLSQNHHVKYIANLRTENPLMEPYSLMVEEKRVIKYETFESFKIYDCGHIIYRL